LGGGVPGSQYSALQSNTTGGSNTAVGVAALGQNTTASTNTAVGYASLSNATSQANNTAVGNLALFDLNGGNGRNTAVGDRAIENATSGDSNVAIGYFAGGQLTTGDANVFIGGGEFGVTNPAGYDVTEGNANTFVGHSAGHDVTTGSNNTILGSYSGNQNSLDLRTSSNNIVLSDGDGNPRFVANSGGQVVVGDSTSSFGGGGYTTTQFTVNADSSDYNSAFRTNASIASNAYGIFIHFTSAAPNGTGNGFIQANDSGAQRFLVRSNGGIANYQANDVNLSDERVKRDISPLGSMWDKFKALEIVNFKYNDQTHEDFNIGIIAQQVESVAPEFIDNSGFGETPEDGVPLKTIYTADMYHAAIKALQEAMDRIETLETKVTALES
jgi:hypothetical protein